MEPTPETPLEWVPCESDRLCASQGMRIVKMSGSSHGMCNELLGEIESAHLNLRIQLSGLNVLTPKTEKPCADPGDLPA